MLYTIQSVFNWKESEKEKVQGVRSQPRASLICICLYLCTKLCCIVLYRSTNKDFLCCVSLQSSRKYKYFFFKNYITVNKVFMYKTVLYCTVRTIKFQPSNIEHKGTVLKIKGTNLCTCLEGGEITTIKIILYKKKIATINIICLKGL